MRERGREVRVDPHVFMLGVLSGGTVDPQQYLGDVRWEEVAGVFKTGDGAVTQTSRHGHQSVEVLQCPQVL